jgi:hypothetical protein
MMSHFKPVFRSVAGLGVGAFAGYEFDRWMTFRIRQSTARDSAVLGLVAKVDSILEQEFCQSKSRSSAAAKSAKSTDVRDLTG